MHASARHRVTIIGGGFGGLWLGPFGRTGGFIAWLLWLGIHLVSLMGFANRVIILVRWAWSFFTHGRGSRLMTGQPLLPDIEDPEPPA